MKNLLSIEIISKYDWYIHKGVLPESDIFMFELDKSYYNGILHFSHELTLLFTFVDNKLEVIGGSDRQKDCFLLTFQAVSRILEM